MLQLKVKIAYNKKAGYKYCHLGIIAPKIAGSCLPGQFLNVRIDGGAELLLRRPFSIHRVSGQRIEILYEIIGKGTRALAAKKAGEYLDVIGPLGNGFTYSLQLTAYSLPILVAGGMGVAPLIFLAEKLAKCKAQSVKRKALVLIGAKAKKDILCAKDFEKLGCIVKIATDDGSAGFKGRVTELLKECLLDAKDRAQSIIYACGPRPMLKELSRACLGSDTPAQISLEEHMACGIGACLGCVVQTRQGQKRVCREGPVFDAQEIIW